MRISLQHHRPRLSTSSCLLVARPTTPPLLLLLSPPIPQSACNRPSSSHHPALLLANDEVMSIDIAIYQARFVKLNATSIQSLSNTTSTTA